MSNQPAESEPTWGSVALVTYLPDPLGAFLTKLRSYFPGEDQPEAHITLLPPRALTLPLGAASHAISRMLDRIQPVELELGQVKAFPGTNMLYLSIERGAEELLQLHRSLNDGELFAHEKFEYIPHLTLSGPLTADELNGAVERANEAWNAAGHDRRFLLNEVVVLWQPGASSEKGWNRITSFSVLDSSSGDSSSAGVGN
jgi:2'-5' RNA ligase